ncbi:glycosyl hydrolase family 115 (putative glucuronidase) [Saccharothrix carnea]|uniref:Glycosyl hydrolase family 115 (Putative glucuronidase) n=1 Tax=Saccharothrix carnea TaxID=1280637 RepID=A0A2P8I026_SACCR|nr:glycosyl hydrolase 115 family protein [Saccharothrix carnea]PSL51832.1 glycosyl hydrolase family 115 (putative glucuronidase) [Saccharothrix carnea]
MSTRSPVLSVFLALVVLAALVPVIVLTARAPDASAAADRDYVSFSPVRGGFTLAAHGKAAPLFVSGDDFPGVVRVVDDLRDDVERVTGVRPTVSTGTPSSGEVVLVGTVGRSTLVDGLVAAGKLDVDRIRGKWETSLQQVVENPVPGVRRALVIAGSDQRGTIFGVYDVSRRIGVSPWHYFDDVPARKHSALYVRPGSHTQGTPAVKYRGVFINDENPSTGQWARATFGPGLAPGQEGGLNHRYYEKVFEVMLRLKANYLWPAVWGRAFAEDDPLNHATATRYGVVMGTSHEAPMMRGIEEWKRNPTRYGGTGEWSFLRNATAVRDYWADGIKRMEREKVEGVVTLGMRGEGDTSLPDGDGVELMRDIIASQRQILDRESGTPLAEIPQVFTLYKEVQRYWDRGLRPPDDVTVVFADDNWGNMRKVPDPSLPARAGGYGLYYHFDYVGGGRNYKWVDTINLANTREQLDLSYESGIDRLWVVNVGDLKNEEAPTQFFLDYAWNPDAIPAEGIEDWTRKYAAQNFGDRAAPAIAEVLHTYGQLQARRKPEATNRRYTRGATGAITTDDAMTPYSIENYGELDRVTAEWEELAAKAEAVGRTLPAADRDAYYQLVLYATKATANLYALRKAQFLNRWYASQGRAATNDLAATAEARLADDVAMSNHYNTTLAGGKWTGWQTQTKIGYGDKARYGNNASWQEPPAPDRIYPALHRITVPATAEMGVAIDGSLDWWPHATEQPVLPEFSPYQTSPAQYIEVFNRGTTPFDYRVAPSVPWLNGASGTVTKQARVTLEVDWAEAPAGRTTVPITVTGAGRTVTVQAVVDKPTTPKTGFVEAGGYVSIEADHHTRAVAGNGVSWSHLPDIGRTGSGMRPSPVTAADQTPGGNGARLEYQVDLHTTGPVTVWAYLSPRNNVRPGAGVEYAVSLDDQAPQTVNTTTATGSDDTAMNKGWEMNTLEAVNRTSTTFTVSSPGVHTLKFWAVDPTAVLQKLVIDTGGLEYSYLGPPESHRVTPRAAG